MNRYRNSRVFPVAIILVAIAVTIAALISLARALFFPSVSVSETADISQSVLVSTSDDSSVRMYVRNKIVGNEDFRAYELTVSPSTRTFSSFKGYVGDKIDTISLSNSVKAYEEFVHALDRANLAKGKQLGEAQNDIRGICASGTLYLFQITNKDGIVKELWTTTCSGTRGSLDASYKQLQTLFVDQIPGAAKLIRAL